MAQRTGIGSRSREVRLEEDEPPYCMEVGAPALGVRWQSEAATPLWDLNAWRTRNVRTASKAPPSLRFGRRTPNGCANLGAGGRPGSLGLCVKTNAKGLDHSEISARAFHKLADRYRDKYMDLAIYNDSYRKFCDLLPTGRARVLDAACGPGNAARYLMTLRPDLDLVGIDLAPRMIELAREAVLSARFVVHDCRHLAELKLRFDGIICAFGLPYLSTDEAMCFISEANQALDPGGALFLSLMVGRSEDSGFERCSSGDQVYVNYHSDEQIVSSLRSSGFEVLKQCRIPSPTAAPKRTTDLIVIARK